MLWSSSPTTQRFWWSRRRARAESGTGSRSCPGTRRRGRSRSAGGCCSPSGVVREQARDEQDEVLEVDRVRGAQALFVRAVEAQGDVVHVRVRRGLVGSAPLLLVLVDVGEHGPRRIATLVEVEILESARDHGLLVRRVVDDEVRLDAHRGAVNAEQLRARRVKRPDPERASQVRAAESLEPGAHLARRLVGERHGEDAPGRYAQHSRRGSRCDR